MEKNIKDYLHLYLGCEIYWQGFILKTIGIDTNYVIAEHEETIHQPLISVIKPILRPLSDMTEEERDEIRIIRREIYTYKDGHDDILMRDAASSKFLLSKHLDLFSLIDAGLAIDKTKLTQHQP